MSGSKVPVEVLACWHELRDTRISRIDTGLINNTYLLDCKTSRFILQRLHPVFRAEVNCDIQAVTERLTQRGLATPTIVPCDNNALWAEHDGRVWRLLTYQSGHTVQAVRGTTMAREAGRIAAVFHDALGDFDYEYRSGRGHVHDTPAHLDRLVAALNDHRDHRLHGQVEPLALKLLAADRHDTIDDLPLRHCHGDLKISNILFDDDDRAVCLIDLDTVNRMAWPLEMGDALRSWCNRSMEDQPQANLDLALLDASIRGYAAAKPAWLTAAETDALITGLTRICLELAARFLTDALTESYFGWDSSAYPARGEHNLARGKSMTALYDDVLDKRSAAEKIVKQQLFAKPG